MRKPLSLKRLVVSLGLLLLLAGTAGADTKVIEGTTNVEDTRMFSKATTDEDNNYGTSTLLYAGYGQSGQEYKTLIRVKNVASELGVGATISACICSIYIGLSYSADNFDLSAHQILKPWVEGSQTSGLCETSGATWNDWDCTDDEWTTAGCDCANDDGVDNSEDDGACDASTKRDRKSTAESTVNILDSDDGVWKGWSISAELAQAWYDGTANENGIVLLTTSTTTNDYCYMRSTEYSSVQPFFVFTYTTDGEPAAGQVIIIGALDEENYHNPRLGIPSTMWE